MAEMINVLVVEPQKAPYMKEIESSLESLQKEVGGYIESTYPWVAPVALIANEEGDIFDVVAGTFLVVGLGEDAFTSLDEKSIPKFTELFGTPERFVRLNGQLCVFPMDERKAESHEIHRKPKQKSHDREAR